MKFVVLAYNERWELLKAAAPDAEWIKHTNVADLLKERNADALFITDNHCDTDYAGITCPVFINEVNFTISELKVPENVIRINGWHGFMEKPLWELSGKISKEADAVLKALNKKYIVVPDEPGFITARIIAMIINEAFYARGENISTEQDIDLAMKLGTNYPYGPFEWSRLIGLKNIYALLKKLSVADERYIPAPAMEVEINTPQ